MQDTGIHWDIARYLVESVRRSMPDVQVMQLTNDSCPAVDGVEAIRIPGDMPMGIRRLKHYASLAGDWCFVDTDVLFMQDVRGVFDDPFDVAVVSREGSALWGTEYAQVFPYNFGVVFSRCPEFWRVALERVNTLSPDQQEWEGEQWATGKIADSGLFRVKFLPREYNFTPEKGEAAEAKILHMKGPRKKLIPKLMGDT